MSADSDRIAERAEYHADAILRAAGSGLRHYTMAMTRRAILSAALDAYEEAYRHGASFASRREWKPISEAPRHEGFDDSPQILVMTASGRVFVSQWVKWNGGEYQWCNGEGRELPSEPGGDVLLDPLVAFQMLPDLPHEYGALQK